ANSEIPDALASRIAASPESLERTRPTTSKRSSNDCSAVRVVMPWPISRMRPSERIDVLHVTCGALAGRRPQNLRNLQATRLQPDDRLWPHARRQYAHVSGRRRNSRPPGHWASGPVDVTPELDQDAVRPPCSDSRQVGRRDHRGAGGLQRDEQCVWCVAGQTVERCGDIDLGAYGLEPVDDVVTECVIT